MPTRIGYPSDGGLRGKFKPSRAADDFPYSIPGHLSDEPTAPTNTHGMTHRALTPKDTEHSAWEAAVREVSGTPIMIGKASPGGMTGVVSGGRKFGNDPFDHEVDDDELSKAGRVNVSTSRLVNRAKPADLTHEAPDVEVSAVRVSYEMPEKTAWAFLERYLESLENH